MGLKVFANTEPLQVKSCPSLTHLALIGYYSRKSDFLDFDNPALRHLSLAPGFIYDFAQAEWFVAMLRPPRGLERLFLRTGFITYKTARELAEAIESRKDSLQFLLLSDVLKKEEGFVDTSFTNSYFFESVKNCKKNHSIGAAFEAGGPGTKLQGKEKSIPKRKENCSGAARELIHFRT